MWCPRQDAGIQKGYQAKPKEIQISMDLLSNNVSVLVY